MSKIMSVYLKITDQIKVGMKNGLDFEAAKREAYEKYKKELGGLNERS